MSGKNFTFRVAGARRRHHHKQKKVTRREESMNQITYRPRNNLVLIRRMARGKVRGLVMPDAAAEGQKMVVEAVGPKVEDLDVGDEVLAIGIPGEDLVRIPGHTDLYLVREGNVLVVVTGSKE